MSDTVVIGVDSHDGSSRNKKRRKKPGINSGYLVIPEAIQDLNRSSMGKDRTKYYNVFDFKADPEKTNKVYARILQETGVSLDIEAIVLNNKTGITEAEYEQLRLGWKKKHKESKEELDKFNALMEEISITAIEEANTEALDQILEKKIFGSQIYKNYYNKAAYQSILKKSERGLKAAGIFSLVTSGVDVLNSEDKTKALVQEAGGYATSALVGAGVVHGAEALGIASTGIPGFIVAGTALIISAFAGDAAKKKIGNLYDLASENFSIEMGSGMSTDMPYDQYHVFPGKKIKDRSSNQTTSKMPYDMYHSTPNQTGKKEISKAVKNDQEERYWIKENENGLVVRLPYTKEQVLLKKQAKPLLTLFRPHSINKNRGSDRDIPTYTGKGTDGKRARRSLKKERDEALKWSKFGIAMMLAFLPGTKAKRHANGGFVNGTTLSYVGEDGPEAIIPLGGKRRQRGIQLWQQAGVMLNVQEKSNKRLAHKTLKKEKTSAQNKKSLSHIAVRNISINLKENSENNGKGMDLLQLIKTQRGEISDEIYSVIAGSLKEAYRNKLVAG